MIPPLRSCITSACAVQRLGPGYFTAHTQCRIHDERQRRRAGPRNRSRMMGLPLLRPLEDIPTLVKAKVVKDCLRSLGVEYQSWTPIDNWMLWACGGGVRRRATGARRAYFDARSSERKRFRSSAFDRSARIIPLVQGAHGTSRPLGFIPL